MKAHTTTYRLLAELVFIFHLVVVFVIVFGWYFPSLYWFYVATLGITLISEIALGYCFLSKWEFALRKEIAPSLEYDPAFLSYYFYRITGINIPGVYIRYPAIVFLTISLIIALSRVL
jgi:hypothetical protein